MSASSTPGPASLPSPSLQTQSEVPFESVIAAAAGPPAAQAPAAPAAGSLSHASKSAAAAADHDSLARKVSPFEAVLNAAASSPSPPRASAGGAAASQPLGREERRRQLTQDLSDLAIKAVVDAASAKAAAAGIHALEGVLEQHRRALRDLEVRGRVSGDAQRRHLCPSPAPPSPPTGCDCAGCRGCAWKAA